MQGEVEGMRKKKSESASLGRFQEKASFVNWVNTRSKSARIRGGVERLLYEYGRWFWYLPGKRKYPKMFPNTRTRH